MTFSPVRHRDLGEGRTVLVSDAGRFLLVGPAFAKRLGSGRETDADRAAMRSRGLSIDDDDELGMAAHVRDLAARTALPGPLDYLILVPTLRCNLSCSYCQVSRVAESRVGYDWSERTLEGVLALIDGLSAKRVKIEFQGGEPTLRPDLIRAVIDRCARFETAEFVVCTNLQRLDPEIMAILDRPDVFVSTSLDGDAATHARQRTGGNAATAEFLANLRGLIDRHGPAKVSALPTVDPVDPPEPDDLIDAYVAMGIDSIFLRPINYQGFARKRHAASREQGDDWRRYYERFVRRLIQRNWDDHGRVIEETYLSIALRRIFRPGADRHVDLRDPNPMGIDYVVIDHDGIVYPTDEARMLARSSVVDLSLGDVVNGWGGERRDRLNRHVTNRFDPDCSACAYQPFCGRDVVDDISRYGTIDVPRRETEFCRRHLHLFDLAFELIHSVDPAVRHSLARWLRLPGEPTSFGRIAA